jgi:hypothetical protein
LVRVSSARPSSTPAARTQRSRLVARLASRTHAIAPSISGTNRVSEISSVLITTSGGATAAMPRASVPIRGPHKEAAMNPISATLMVPSNACVILAAGGASSPAMA